MDDDLPRKAAGETMGYEVESWPFSSLTAAMASVSLGSDDCFWLVVTVKDSIQHQTQPA
jgi:hypothetical protein